MDGTLWMVRASSPVLRLAGWAITVVEGQIGSLENRVLQIGHVPGILQTPARSELWAWSCSHCSGLASTGVIMLQ